MKVFGESEGPEDADDVQFFSDLLVPRVNRFLKMALASS